MKPITAIATICLTFTALTGCVVTPTPYYIPPAYVHVNGPSVDYSTYPYNPYYYDNGYYPYVNPYYYPAISVGYYGGGYHGYHGYYGRGHRYWHHH